MMLKFKNRLAQITGVWVCIVALAACGGGGGSSTGDGPGGDLGTGSGTMAVLITDAPSDDFEEINLTILAVELLGDDDPITLYEGNRRVNLLDLLNHNEVLAAVDVPAGEYSKIRLQIEDVELVPAEGDPVQAKVTGNGKLDLNPQGTFTVTGGELLVVQLDMDANKSIQVSGPNYNLRPVVFVDILTDTLDGKLVRIEGEAAEVDLGSGVILMCDIDFAVIGGDGFLGGEDESCIEVVAGVGTSVFNALGEPIVIGDIEVGSHTAALGRFELGQGDDLVLDAMVLEVAPAGVYQRFSGRVADLSITDLDFSLVDGDDVYQVDAVVETKLLDRDGGMVMWSDMANGDEVEVEAVAVGAGLFPAVIFVNNAVDEVMLTGDVGSVNLDDSTFELELDAVEQCVVVTSSTELLAITDDGDSSTTTALTLDELASGAEAEVFGYSDNGCVVAETVVVML